MLYDVLHKLNINYEEISHKEVFTIKDAENIKEKINGLGTKTLFLKDKNNSFYLYILKDDKKADLKHLANILNTSRLSFGSAEELYEVISLYPGSVTPLGLINDTTHKVKIIIDNALQNNILLFHPNVNTKTMAISYNDLLKFISFLDNEYIIDTNA